VSGAEQTDDYKWTLGVRYIQGQIDRATLRTTITYRPVPRLSLGIEYNPLASDVNPLVNWLAVKETERRPALILGTSSDRIGTPSGQAYYATVSKNLKRWTKLPIAPYVGAAYGTFNEKIRAIAGGNIAFTEHVSSLLIYDGVNFHPTVSWSQGRHVLTLLLVELKSPGLAYTISFDPPSRSTPAQRRPSEPFTRPGWPR
jgi:hypothetical protein